MNRLVALTAFAALAIVLTASSAAAKRPPTGGGGGGTSTTSTYVKNYANILGGTQYGLTPEDVQATSDGGWIGLAITQSATNGVGVSWLIKVDSVGAPQWQEEVGALSTPPGDYSDAVSVAQTADGGYVIGGGTIGGGSAGNCPSTSGLQCGLVEKVDANGALVWSRVYLAGPDGTGIDQIKTTADGGFIAVGTATDASQNTGALVLKLDSLGKVQWQRELGPAGSNQASFHTVQQTTDGGFVAAGEASNGTTSPSGITLQSTLVAKLDSTGSISWQRVYNDVSSGTVTAGELSKSIIQTSDGGYALGGAWNSTTGAPGSCCQGALLLKLNSDGSLQWQQAYSGGVYCFFNGFNETCRAVGGVVYSVHQTADGGFILAGDSNLEQTDGTPLEPWLAKVDGNAALVWQENDYQVNPTTGRPLSENFAASALTPAGPIGLGFTENRTSGLGELLGVQTDANGAVATCSQIHPASILTATNPGLTGVALSLTSATPAVSLSSAQVQTQATTATATASQC